MTTALAVAAVPCTECGLTTDHLFPVLCATTAQRVLSTVPTAAPSDRGAAYLRSWRVLGYTGNYVPVDVRS